MPDSPLDSSGSATVPNVISGPASGSDSDPSAPPKTGQPAAPLAESNWSVETRKKLAVLNEILASRDDNDPRMDRDLKNLSVEAKQALRERYRTLTPEDRNGRGTVVFLIGRELQSAEDVAFLADVLSEAPCLSLADCSRDTSVSRGADIHQDEGIGVTLSYPQIVSLVSIERFLEKSGGQIPPALRDSIARAVRSAESSPVPAVAQRAHRLASKL